MRHVLSIPRSVATARAWLTLAIIAALALALLAALAYTVSAVLTSPGPKVSPKRAAVPPAVRAGTPSASPVQRQMDELAARPMAEFPASAARPHPLARTGGGAPISLPAASSTDGPVVTGFPHTPEGALAQLAALDAVALRDLSPNQVRMVHDWAALPGAVALTSWTPYVAATAALAAAGAPEGSTDLTSTFTPVAGVIKGTVGSDFVVACVLGEWQVTYRASSRSGAADCQRMVWTNQGWRIGPGAQPAYGPSVWPGSHEAARAGWRAFADA